MKIFLAATLLLFLNGSDGALDTTRLPDNDALTVGQTAILSCAVHDHQLPHSVQWTEYTNPDGPGQPISDNTVIGNHPNRDRYHIHHRDNAEYSLEISNLVLTDGGVYVCEDAQALTIEKRRHACFLTVVEEPTNCTTTIGASGIVIEDTYQTNDCIVRYGGVVAPNMTYTGPQPFEQLSTATNDLVWAGMHYNVTRDMDTRAHQCTTYFTAYFHPVDGDTSDKVPEYNYVHQSRQMFVYWGPKNMVFSGQKPYYVPGDQLTCSCDAWPLPTFFIQNMRTGQITTGPTVTVDSAWEGFNQSLRCEARNTIEGTIYSQNIFIPLDVPVRTTPTTPTTTPTTTPPPAVSECPDPSGAWVSTNPTQGTLCLNVNTAAFGVINGLLKNATDTYWVEMFGRTQIGQFNQLGLNGIWPSVLGVSSLVGECHRCFGVENLLINVVNRRKGTVCGTEGLTQYTTQYHFYRSPTVNCPSIPTV